MKKGVIWGTLVNAYLYVTLVRFRRSLRAAAIASSNAACLSVIKKGKFLDIFQTFYSQQVRPAEFQPFQPDSKRKAE